MTSDLHVLWRERQEVGAALDKGSLADDDPAWKRFPELDEAIRDARPTDPAGLAIQLRLLADSFAARGYTADEELALSIATTLEGRWPSRTSGTPLPGKTRAMSLRRGPISILRSPTCDGA
jgi:hypothetical protein